MTPIEHRSKDTIGVLDTTVCNIRSLTESIAGTGHSFVLIDDPSQFAEIGSLIIPGVGSMAAAMAALDRRAVIDRIRGFAAEGNPVLGICLGMQMLFERSAEGGGTSGLGLLAGDVRALDSRGPSRSMHIGWNDVRRVRDSVLLDGEDGTCDFYFVHGYHVVPSDPTVVTGVSDWHGDIVSVVEQQNIVGVQFHPEKSQNCGERILANFLRL